MTVMVRVAVIGYGHLGRWHVEKAIKLPNCQLVAVVDHNLKAQARFRERHPGHIIVADLQEIEDQIDAAIIVTPTSCHFDFIKKLMAKGKHIFCEKPLTSTLKEAVEIQQLCQNSKILLQVGHSERFHSIWERRSEFPEFFDTPGFIRIQRVAPFKGRSVDIDVIQDLMIHDLDLMLYLFKEWPKSVQVKGYKVRTDKWDFVSAHFEFPSERSVAIVASRIHPVEMRELEISNEFGCFYVDTIKCICRLSRADKKKIEEFNYTVRDHLLEEQKAFYQAIGQGTSAIVGVDDGVNAMKLAEAVANGLNGTGKYCVVENSYA